MAKKKLYCCPIHNSVILFEEIIEERKIMTKIFIPPKVETCTQCNKPYIKNECVTKIIDE